jgi:predicted nucleotidyltransferase
METASSSHSIDSAVLKNYFAESQDVVGAYLFGSYARGQASPLSDVAIAVLLDNTCSVKDYFDRRLQFIGDLSDVNAG